MPSRCLLTSNATGTVELHTWDRATGVTRQATARPGGTPGGFLTPDGEWVWWFSDANGNELGTWVRQPFLGGASQPALPGVQPGYAAGLALGRTVVAAGRSDRDGVEIFVARYGESSPRRAYFHSEQATVGALSRDDSLLAFGHAEHGNAERPAIRVIHLADAGWAEPAAELWDGPERGLWIGTFSPVPGSSQLLVFHERGGFKRPLVWDPIAGTEKRVEVDKPGEIDAVWYPDGAAILLHHEHGGRSELFRYELLTGACRPLPTAPGSIGSMQVRPDGTIEYEWSSSVEQPRVLTVGRRDPPRTSARAVRRSVPLDDLFVPTANGGVGALLARPDGVSPPFPTVFLIHGGPAWRDADAFDPVRAAWVDHGFAVVHVNYRGSTGYGSAWREAINLRPGMTELDDIAAVRAALVGSGTLDPRRLVLAGRSWGGYLVLLGLAVQAGAWTAGVAGVPVADTTTVYEDQLPTLRAAYRVRFGGTPDDVPEAYRVSSPITYAERLQAPVLVLAGGSDARCPMRQIDMFLERLRALGKPHEEYRYDGGHGLLGSDARIREMEVQLDFANRHLASIGTESATNGSAHGKATR